MAGAARRRTGRDARDRRSEHPCGDRAADAGRIGRRRSKNPRRAQSRGTRSVCISRPDAPRGSLRVDGANSAYEISGLEAGNYEIGFTEEPCVLKGTAQTRASRPGVLRRRAIARRGEPGPRRRVQHHQRSRCDARRTRPRQRISQNGRLSEPTGSNTFTLPGAIEPAPFNQQVEEEFWAKRPWEKAASPAPAPPTPGVAVAIGAATSAAAAPRSRFAARALVPAAAL